MREFMQCLLVVEPFLNCVVYSRPIVGFIPLHSFYEDLHVDIVHEKRSLVCSVERLQENKYQVTFMPRSNGKHRVYVYFNGYDVKGSPFIMKVGSKGRSGKTRTSPAV